MSENITTKNGKLSIEKRYYITSLTGDAEEFGNAVRKHWEVESVPQKHRRSYKSHITKCA